MTPRCSIIIPLFNRAELTQACLESLAGTLPAGIEIVLVDNGSSDGTAALIARLPHTVISNAQNLGFAKACNQGAAAAKSDRLLFLNNDIIALPNWFEPLMAALDADPLCGAVGARLHYPDGKLQHAGVESVERKGTPYPLEFRHRFHTYMEQYPPALVSGPVQAVTGACFLIRREAFDQAGGFDEAYWNGYEDMELCMQLQAHGWGIHYEANSALVHLESASGPERMTGVAANVRRLNERWAGKVTATITYEPDGTRKDLPKPRPAAVPGRTSVIVLAYNQAGYTRLCLESALEAGGDIELIIIDNSSTDDGPEFYDELASWNPRVKVIHNPRNLGYGTGNNQGLAIATGDMIVFLNNDAVVGPGWHERLRAHFTADPSLGAVGPITNEISGVQKLLKIPFANAPTSYHSMLRFDRMLAQAAPGEGFATHRLVGFCLMVKRDVIDRIGGFDPVYGIGNYEDDDFCLRILELNCTMRVAQDVYVHHFGSATFKALGLKPNEPDHEIGHARLCAKFRMPKVTFQNAKALEWRQNPDLHYIDLPDPASPAWYPSGKAFTPNGRRYPLQGPAPTVFFHHPRWTTIEWQDVVSGFAKAFKPGDPVTLVLWLDPWQGLSLERAQDVIGKAVEQVGCRLEDLADLMLVPERLDQTELNMLYRAASVVVAPNDDIQAGRGRACGKPVLEDLSVEAWRAFVRTRV